jgi:periplasmic protein TonB
MAAAAASLPPPSPFGARDLRANARKFFERALVISALVHLSVVAAVRIVEDRSASQRGEDVPTFEGTVHLSPPLIPPQWMPPGLRNPVVPGDGTIVMTPDIPRVDITSPGIPAPPDAAVPGTEDPVVGGTTTGGTAKVPPREVTEAFTHADVPPVPIDAPKPAYPDWAREAGVEGKVVLRVLVGADGLPIRVDIISGPKGLTEEAQKAVQRWKFRPGLSGKIPVKVWVEVPVSFRL